MKRQAARDAARAFNFLQCLCFVGPARNARFKNTAEQKAADLSHKQHLQRGRSRKCALTVVRLNALDARQARVESCARLDTPSHANLSSELSSFIHSVSVLSLDL